MASIVENLSRKIVEAEAIFNEGDKLFAGRCGVTRETIQRLRTRKVKSALPETIRAINNAHQQAKAQRDGEKNPAQRQRQQMAAAITDMLSDEAVMELYPKLMQYVTQDMMGQWGTEGGPIADVLEKEAAAEGATESPESNVNERVLESQ